MPDTSSSQTSHLLSECSGGRLGYMHRRPQYSASTYVRDLHRGQALIRLTASTLLAYLHVSTRKSITTCELHYRAPAPKLFSLSSPHHAIPFISTRKSYKSLALRIPEPISFNQISHAYPLGPPTSRRVHQIVHAHMRSQTATQHARPFVLQECHVRAGRVNCVLSKSTPLARSLDREAETRDEEA